MRGGEEDLTLSIICDATVVGLLSDPSLTGCFFKNFRVTIRMTTVVATPLLRTKVMETTTAKVELSPDQST